MRIDNICVLSRTIAIKKMTALGIGCILVRDPTGAGKRNPVGRFPAQSAAQRLVEIVRAMQTV